MDIPELLSLSLFGRDGLFAQEWCFDLLSIRLQLGWCILYRNGFLAGTSRVRRFVVLECEFGHFFGLHFPGDSVDSLLLGYS